MPMLSVNELEKYYGADLVFRGISFALEPGEKLALVGRNGTGKTTLLRLLLGRLEPDGGRVAFAAGCRPGYLSQDPELGDAPTVEAEAISALALVHRTEARLRELEQQMSAAGPEALPEIMAEYARTTARFEAAGGYDAPARVKMVLYGLGFRPADLELPVATLSGGQKVRLGLAKLLLESPDVLLLDEPTNHLDLEATEWLEGYLKSYRGTVIIVSHDRYFLDRVTGKTLEMEDHGATLYPGNYSFYVQTRAERLKQQYAHWRRQQDEAEKLRAYIRKYGAGNRSTQAHDRERKLEHMELIDKPKLKEKQMGLRFEQDHDSGNEVLALDGVGHRFGDRQLFADVNFAVRRGQRIALVGPNGAGKTTLLKILAGRLKQSAGQIWWGVGIDRAYFSQDLDQVNPANTVLGEIMDLPGMTNFEARSLLGRFLFPADMVERLVGDLSGGERNRLTLAKLMISGANVLLLDEPTNHLDIDSKQMLEQALAVFPGTVFLVSHDRYFLDQVATHVWAFGGGAVRAFTGNYSAYRAVLEAEALAAAPAAAEPAAEADQRRTDPRAEEARPRRGKGAADREQKKQEEAVRRLEAAITAAEARKHELEERMGDPEFYRLPESRAVLAEYRALEGDLGRLYAEWEAAAGL